MSFTQAPPPPPPAQPAFEIQSMPLSPPSQTLQRPAPGDHGCRRGQTRSPPPRVFPQPRHSLPGKGTRAQPSVSLQASRGARQMQRSQPSSRPSAAAARWVPHARARRIARRPGSGWQRGGRCGPGAAAWRDGLAGPRSCPLDTRGLTRAPSSRQSPPEPTQDTPPGAANATRGAAGSAPHQDRDRWRRVTMATHGARRPASASWNPLT